MKGCNGLSPRSNSSLHHFIKEFTETYRDTIQYIHDTIPGDVSVGVCGAMGKAVLWYGPEKIKPFCEAFAKKDYKGLHDPVHVLWNWLVCTNAKTPRQVYQKTVAVIRHFVNNKPFPTMIIKAAKDDIFEWNSDYKTMISPKKSRWSSDKIILQEIDDAFKGGC